MIINDEIKVTIFGINTFVNDTLKKKNNDDAQYSQNFMNKLI